MKRSPFPETQLWDALSTKIRLHNLARMAGGNQQAEQVVQAFIQLSLEIFARTEIPAFHMTAWSYPPSFLD